MAPDMMHDLFEGAFAHIIRHVTKGLIDEGALTLEDLKRVETFPYGYNDRKNRPEPLTAAFLQGGASLKGTAAQKWCLFRLFPLIFGTSVQEENKHWSVLLQLHNIVTLVLSEKITEDWVAYLEVLVKDFVEAFTAMYPTAEVLPKMHYMVHYARLTAALGPLRQYWCLRFEAKHQYFKSMASKVKNFINICKTLATRHQLLQSYEMNSLKFPLCPRMLCARAVDKGSLPAAAQSLECKVDLLEAKSVFLDAGDYRVEDILVVGTGEVPQFAQVRNIYVSKNDAFLLLERLATNCFHQHICAYEVTKTGVLQLSKCGPELEASHQHLDLYNGGHVCLRYDILF
ncbi:unnamed protein product [Ixodes pacificus]